MSDRVMTEAIVSEATRLQCPACGEPIAATTVRIAMPTEGVKALELQCGHAITMQMANESWGFDLPTD